MVKARDDSMTLDSSLASAMETMASAFSKITRPEAHEAWPRERLFGLVDKARACPVVWVSASAGSGKTTLASSYIETRELLSLWYQLDAGDVDIGSFFHYLSLAAATVVPGLDTRLPSPPHPLSRIENFARHYMRALFQSLGPSGVIVLDNYQETDSELLDTVVRIAAVELPPGLNMIVLSRFPPPRAFSGLIVNGAIALLGEEAISLDLEETAGIARHLAAAVTDEEVEQWNEVARGWVAGLVLLAKAGGQFVLGSEDADIRNLLFDYFTSETMSHFSDAEREMLLHASLLKTMTVAGVKRLVGDHDVGELLRRLHVQNYFTSRRRDTYQFHPLFHEFLRTQAVAQLDDHARDDMRLHAARISMAEGRLDEAIDLLIEVGQWRELCRIIPAHGAAVAAQGRLTTLERWIRAIPPEERVGSPWIGFWLGMCRLPYDPEEASGYFAACIPDFERNDDFAGVAASWSKQIESIMHVWGDFTRLDEPLDLIDRVLTGDKLATLPARLHFDVIQNALLALQWRQPGHARLPEIEERACYLLHHCAEPTLQATCSIYLTIYYCWRGRYSKAGVTLEPLHTVMQYAQLPPPMLAAAEVTECLMAWRVDADFERCLTGVETALRLCAEADVHIWDTNLIGHAAAAALSKGDNALAGETLGRMRQCLPHSRPFDTAQYYVLAGWHAWAEGRTNEAREYLAQALDVFNAIGVPWGIGLAHAGYALVTGHEDPSYEEHVASTIQLMQHNDSTEIRYPLLLAMINTALQRGQERQAGELIAKLYAIGREHGIWNCYFWDATLLGRISVEALERGIEAEYTVDLIRRRELLPPDPECAPEHWPWRIKVYAFGSLNVEIDGKLLVIGAKGPAKPLALLQLLVAYGGTDVSERKFVDALWPESDGDAALRALDTTLHRLRKVLGDEQAVQLRNKRLSIDPARVWVDVRTFRRLVERAQAADAVSAVELYQRAIDMYRGPFLDDEEGAPVIVERERLQREFMQAVSALGDRYEAGSAWELAIRCYEKGLAVDGQAENLYQRLMIAHRELGHPAEGLAIYQRCRQMLSSAFATLPSAETERISATLRQS